MKDPDRIALVTGASRGLGAALAEALAAAHGVAITRVSEVGQPAGTVVQYCEENDVDRVVVGTHGRDGVSRVPLGSVAELIVRRAPSASASSDETGGGQPKRRSRRRVRRS